MWKDETLIGINMQGWKKAVINKKVLFITTKNIDYIRNTQEIAFLEKYAQNLQLLYSQNTKYLFRLLNVSYKLLLCNIKNFDVIFIGFSPQLILPFFYRKLKRKIIIIDFFISVYDTMVNDRKKFRVTSLAAKLCHKLDEKTMDKSCYIISDTKAHARYFCEEFGISREKIDTLYLEADRTIFFPRSCEKPIQLKGKFVVLYFGSILPLQGVEVILSALDELKDRGELYFLVIGKIGSKYKKPLGSNIQYIDWVSQEKLAEYIAMADLCLAGHFNNKIGKAKRTIPGKAYIYEAMEKKMVLGENEANREIFTEDSKHYFVEMGNAEALKNVIIKILDAKNA